MLSTTFKDCALFWLENYMRGSVKNNTYMGTYYYPTTKHLIPYFGSMQIPNITPSIIQSFFNAKTKEYSQESINKIKKCLQNILELSVDEGIIHRNPLNKRIRTISQIPKKRKSVWNKTQYEIAFEFALTHPDGLGPLILMDTGISRSELLGITWRDILFEQGCILICRSTVSMQNPTTLRYYIHTGDLKNAYRERIIPLTGQAINRLKLEYQQVLNIGKQKNLSIDKINQQFIVSNQHGNVMDPSNWSSRNFKRFMNDLIREHHLPKLSPHELRHTRSTLWFHENIDPIALCMVGGWCNLNMPRKLYIHSSIDILKEKLNRC